jgi:hypothetical protein
MAIKAGFLVGAFACVAAYGTAAAFAAAHFVPAISSAAAAAFGVASAVLGTGGAYAGLMGGNAVVLPANWVNDGDVKMLAVLGCGALGFCIGATAPVLALV